MLSLCSELSVAILYVGLFSGVNLVLRRGKEFQDFLYKIRLPRPINGLRTTAGVDMSTPPLSNFSFVLCAGMDVQDHDRSAVSDSSYVTGASGATGTNGGGAHHYDDRSSKYKNRTGGNTSPISVLGSSLARQLGAHLVRYRSGVVWMVLVQRREGETEREG